MYIEVYLDVLFLVNLWMDYLILILTNIVQKRPLKRIRCFIGGVIGAFGVCLLLLLPVRKSLAILLPAHMVTSTLMVKIGCKIKDIRSLVRCMLTLYLITFLWGGLFFALDQTPAALHLRTFLFLSTISYEVLHAAVRIYGRQKRHRENSCEVTLYVQDKSKKVRGLYDTGNLLTDPLSGKPVSVAASSAVEDLIGALPECNEALKPHYIPFQTVGPNRGMLLAVTIESMVIERNGVRQTVTRPVLAFSEETVAFARHYQLILNPNLIDS